MNDDTSYVIGMICNIVAILIVVYIALTHDCDIWLKWSVLLLPLLLLISVVCRVLRLQLEEMNDDEQI